MNTWILHFFLGISSGLPFLLTLTTLQAWMTEEHVNLKAIGIFALVRFPYSVKFLWAPFIDKISLPFLTRRRGWMVLTQGLVALSVLALGLSNPVTSPWLVAGCAVLVAFMSASQDVVIDAYRTESLSGNAQALATSAYITGYRVGMMIAGALALYLVDQFKISWSSVYALMAAFMVIGTVAALLAPEKEVTPAPRSMKEAVVEPFLEFFRRPGAIWVLLFIMFFKFGDNLASAMTTPFLLSIGYTKTEYALVVKGAGFIAVLVGGFLGGPIMMRVGAIRSLWVFGLGQALAVSGFAVLAVIPKNLSALSWVIMSENFFIGCGAAALTAYVSSVTSTKYTATQYALLTSFMSLSSTVLSSPSGYLVNVIGWNRYFIFCALLAIPGLLLLAFIQKKGVQRVA
jgi:PAT family beta-lactamase induction signal transducer AmpG